MDNKSDMQKNKMFINNMVESAIRIGLLFFLIFWTFDIISPFIIPVLWGSIIAVALMPLAKKLEKKLNGRRGLSATILAILGILLLVIPFVMTSSSLFNSIIDLVNSINKGEINIPAPTQRIADIPIVGQKIFDAWLALSINLHDFLIQFLPQLKAITSTLLSIAGSSFVTLIMSIISLIIAAALITHANSASTMVTKFSVRAVGQHGKEWATLTAATIRSVLVGVIGVAFIQSMIIGAAFFAFSVPFAGLLTIAVLILAIAQLPALIVVAPTIFYVFSIHDGMYAVIFTIWAIGGGISDNFIKPFIMGRGVDVPMPVILIGAIGGMFSAGIIGLFLGAVLLAIAYQLFTVWINQEEIAEKVDKIEEKQQEL